MKSFLQKIAEVFLKKHKDELSSYNFVFPNRRSGQFFKKAIAEEIDSPVFLPSISTIIELFSELSPLTQSDNLGLLVELYHVYKEVRGTDESFDEFSSWGEMLLSDFDDIDKYLVDASLLYGNIASLKEIEEEFRELNPEEQERLDAIRRFWQNFDVKSKGKDDFMRSWEGLFDVYQTFKTSLKKKGTAYQGMLFRSVVEQLQDLKPSDLATKTVFVGFNALTPAEEKLFRHLQTAGLADFYWDFYGGALLQSSNRASHFIRENMKKFPPGYTLYTDDELKYTAPEIRVISVASNLGQTKIAGTLLQEIETPGIETAVVLADEDQLIPMLQNMPSNVDKLNVTMGYPLKITPVYAFFNLMIEIQKNFSLRSGEPWYHSRLVLRFLNSHLVNRLEGDINDLRQRIIESNLIYLSAADFKGYALLSKVFRVAEQGRDIIAHFVDVFGFILEAGSSMETEDDIEEVILNELEREFLFLIYKRLTRFMDLMDEQRVPFGRDVIIRLISRILEAEAVPFEGEPLSGLQVMGVLETRALDFKNLILLGMNDGTFPKSTSANTYIPYNLRKGFGLPTIEDQDAIYAYYFYRLLQRSKKVTLVYNSMTEGLNSGEESRFIKQLRFLYHPEMIEQVLTHELSSERSEKISIDKSDLVIEKLNEFKNGGKRKFSATSLLTYLECPLKFYLGYVERLKEPDEVHEDLDARLMGDVFHDAVENFYKPLEGKPLDADMLKMRLKNKALLDKIIRESFAEVFFKKNRSDAKPLKGKFVIYGNVVQQYLEKVIKLDIEQTPKQYIEGEKIINQTIPVDKLGDVSVFGKIDRVDETDEGIRIIDYKTGAFGDLKQFSFKEMDELFEPCMKENRKSLKKALFQTFYYAMLYELETKHTSIIPAIYYMRGLFKDVNPYILAGDKKDRERIRYHMIEQAYREKLNDLIGEIFDASVAFIQTTELKTCSYCEFKAICNR